MRFPLFIAWRYLRGLRGLNAAPLLSRISMLALAVGAAAMVILFSVFNGFDDVVQDLYKAFYPDLRITAEHGKFFDLSDKKLNQLQKIPGIVQAAPLIMDKALAASNGEQVPVTLIGADDRFFRVNQLGGYITDGDTSLASGNLPVAIAGEGICVQLGVGPQDALSRINLSYPNPAGNPAMNPLEAYQSLSLVPTGIFHVQPEFDNQYILAPLSLVRELFLQNDQSVSSMDLKTAPGIRLEDLKKQISAVMGSGFKTETRFEQNRSVFRIIQTEKWVIYIILLFVLLIASVTMIGAISLLALEKQKDAAMLRAMGSRPATIRNVFILEGLLWGLLGGFIGLLFGLAICFGQQYFGWIKLNGFVIDAYPVAIHWKDIVLVFFTVIIVGGLAAWMPAVRLSRRKLHVGFAVR